MAVQVAINVSQKFFSYLRRRKRKKSRIAMAKKTKVPGQMNQPRSGL
jgi:hypothetical protein